MSTNEGAFFMNDAGRRCSRRIRAAAERPAAPVAPAPPARPAPRSRVPVATRGRAQTTTRGRGGARGGGRAAHPRATNGADSGSKRKRPVDDADDDDSDEESDKDDKRPKKRRGKQRAAKEEAPKKRKRDEDDEDEDEDDKKSKKKKIGGRNEEKTKKETNEKGKKTNKGKMNDDQKKNNKRQARKRAARNDSDDKDESAMRMRPASKPLASFTRATPDPLPEQVYQPEAIFFGPDGNLLPPLGSRSRSLRRHETAMQHIPSDTTTPSVPVPPISTTATPHKRSHWPNRDGERRHKIPLPSQTQPDWHVEGNRAQSPNGTRYRWYERELTNYVPPRNMAYLLSAAKREADTSRPVTYRIVDEGAEARRSGLEPSVMRRRPLHRQEVLWEFGWVRESPLTQAGPSAVRCHDGGEEDRGEGSSSSVRQSEVRSSDGLVVGDEEASAVEELEEADEADVEEEVTYVGKGKGRAD